MRGGAESTLIRGRAGGRGSVLFLVAYFALVWVVKLSNRTEHDALTSAHERICAERGRENPRFKENSLKERTTAIVRPNIIQSSRGVAQRRIKSPLWLPRRSISHGCVERPLSDRLGHQDKRVGRVAVLGTNQNQSRLVGKKMSAAKMREKLHRMSREGRLRRD